MIVVAGMTRLSKLAAAARNPAYWPALRRGILPTTDHEKALRPFDFKTVIDVGANKGQFASFARVQWPDARLICFEPLPGPRRKLQSLLPHAKVFDYALGAASGRADIHVASREDSSSLLPLGILQKSMFAMQSVGQMEVEVRRLDEVIETDDLSKPVLLKIDVQGLELLVLEGAEGLLPNIHAIYVEASFKELYCGQHLAGEVISFAESKGFSSAGLFNTLSAAANDVVQADFLFLRSGEFHRD